MSEHDLELLRTRYEAFARGDWDASFANLDPEFEVHDHGLTDASFFRGPDAIREAQANVDNVFGSVHHHPEELIDLEGRVLVRVKFSARGKGSGVELNTEIAHLWTMKDGRPVRLDIHRSWEEAAAAANYPVPKDD